MKTNKLLSFNDSNFEIMKGACHEYALIMPYPSAIIETKSGNIVFASEGSNNGFLCGYQTDEVLNKGWEFIEKICAPESSEFLENIIKTSASLFKSIDNGNKDHFTLSFNCDFLTSDKNLRVTINLKFTPTFADFEGNITHILCTFFPGNDVQKNTLVVKDEISSERWFYEKGKWIKANHIDLSDMEKLMITYTCKGLSIKMIASIMNKSVETIRKYRKSVFEKL